MTSKERRLGPADASSLAVRSAADQPGAPSARGGTGTQVDAQVGTLG
jgi:hypothetical protein